MTDVYTFECDLDRNLPEDERAGLDIHHDGEHIVFGLAGGLAANREIYLTPDMAGYLASLLGALTAAEADPPDKTRSTARLIAGLCVGGLFVGALVGLVYAVVALVASL